MWLREDDDSKARRHDRVSALLLVSTKGIKRSEGDISVRGVTLERVLHAVDREPWRQSAVVLLEKAI